MSRHVKRLLAVVLFLLSAQLIVQASPDILPRGWTPPSLAPAPALVRAVARLPLVRPAIAAVEGSFGAAQVEPCPYLTTGRVRLDKAHYQPGETVQIAGSGFGAACRLMVAVDRPVDEAVAVVTGADGAFALAYELGSTEGRYRITVSGVHSLAGAEFTSGPWLQTDKDDYAPGDRVTITGGGMLAGEIVRLVLEESPVVHGDRTLWATADGRGEFTNVEFSPEAHHVGVRFTLTATGQTSERTVQAAFTDAITVASRQSGTWSDRATWLATNTGQITVSTSSPSVTGNSSARFLDELVAGDILLRTDNTTVIGTVASITAQNALTLTANALVTATTINYRSNSVPKAGDNVVIDPGHTVVVDGSFTANSIIFSTSTIDGVRKLAVGGSNSLTVTNTLQMGSGSGGAARQAWLDVASGSVAAGTLGASGDSVRVDIESGSLSVTGTATIRGTGSNTSLTDLSLASGSFGANALEVFGGVGAATGRFTVTDATGTVNVEDLVDVDGFSGTASLDVGPGTLNAGSFRVDGGSSGASAGLKIGSGWVTVSRSFTFTGPGARNVTFTGAGTLKVGGSFPTGGTLTTVSGSTVEFNGTGTCTQTMGPYTYENVTVNSACSGGVSLGGAATVNGQLSMLGGNVTTGANTLSVGAGGTASRSSGQVVGNLLKSFATGEQSFTYPIGTSTQYTPVHLAFASVSSAGTVLATTTSANHPNIGTAGFSGTSYVNRYWTLTPGGGLAFSTYDATFTYGAGDTAPGTPSAYAVKKFSGGTWSAPPGGSSAAGTSVSGLGFTAFSDYAVGNPPCTPTGTSEAECNGVDDDCDGSTDEDYAPADCDGADSDLCNEGTTSCTAGVESCGDSSGDTVEVCNGADDDCDGSTDEGVTTTFYADGDSDGYGNVSSTTEACTAPSGYVADATDCDDTRAGVNPGATEVCDAGNVDEDCDGTADDADTAADGKTTWYTDVDNDGYGVDPSQSRCDPSGDIRAPASGDCNDGDSGINPGATEVCDAGNVDEDCDGVADDADTAADGKTTWYTDVDGDTYGTGSGESRCDASGDVRATNDDDCDDTRATVNPAGTEVCDADNLDEDCDGTADDADTAADGKTTWYTDVDGDGYGVDPSESRCDPSGDIRAPAAGDCNDGEASVNPGATEVCDAGNVDEDCDGTADDADSAADGKTTWYTDVDGDTYGTGSGESRCDASGDVRATNDDDCDDTRATVNPAGTEVCDPDNLDEDCDGAADDADSAADGKTPWYTDVDFDGFGTEPSDSRCDATGLFTARAANDLCATEPGTAMGCPDADADGVPNTLDCANGLAEDRVVDPAGVLAAFLPAGRRHPTLQAAVTAAADNNLISMYADTIENVIVGITTGSGDRDLRIVGCGHKVTAADATRPVIAFEPTAGRKDADPGKGERDIHVDDVDVYGGARGYLVQTSRPGNVGTNTLISGVFVSLNAVGLRIGGHGNILRDSTIVQNGAGVEVVGSNTLIVRNYVAGSTGTGIKVTGDTNHVNANGVGEVGVGNGAYGIDVFGQRNQVGGNSVFANVLAGVRVQGRANQVMRNTVGEAGKGNGAGIVIAGNENLVGTVTENFVYANLGIGLQVTGDENQLANNRIGEALKGNAGDGINVKGAGNRIRGNLVYSSGGDGIEAGGGTIWKPNVIARNLVGDIGKGNLGNGLLVKATGNGTTAPVEIDANHIYANALNGVYVTGTKHQLRLNTSGGAGGLDNGQCEFLVAAGNFNATGNTANGALIPGANGTAFPTVCQGTP